MAHEPRLLRLVAVSGWLIVGGCATPDGDDLATSAIAHPGPSVADATVLSVDPKQSDVHELTLEIEPAVSECPDLELEIDMRRTDEYVSDRGVLVKVLQLPEFTDANRLDPNDPADVAAVPPERWDRSEFPAGACVVRLRGVEAACYTTQTSRALYLPPTDSGAAVSQSSYHARRWSKEIDLCAWRVPGCPRSKWGSFGGYWWYLSQREQDSLLVACASSCAQFFTVPITLELRSEEDDSLCPEP
jgi:hypothetical protein